MENTYLEKIKFFSQYIGQKVLILDLSQKEPQELTLDSLKMAMDTSRSRLVLRPVWEFNKESVESLLRNRIGLDSSTPVHFNFKSRDIGFTYFMINGTYVHINHYGGCRTSMSLRDHDAFVKSGFYVGEEETRGWVILDSEYSKNSFGAHFE